MNGNRTINNFMRRTGTDFHLFPSEIKKGIKKMKSLSSKNNSRSLQRRGTLELTALALPAIIYMIVFNYIPLYGLVLPFKDFNAAAGFLGSDWCGFENFKFLFGGKSIMTALRNTICYNVAFIIIGKAIPVILALLLFEVSKKHVKVFHTTYLLPYFISMVAVAYIVNAFLNIDTGLVNKLLVKFGHDPIMWYNEPKYWPFIITGTAVWKGMGYVAIIYYAALMGVDTELFEAAEIDGAGKFKQIWYISLPLIRSMIILTVILDIGKIMNSDFGLFYNIPMNSTLLYETTDTMDTFIYRALMSTGDVGMSSAAGAFQAVVGFILVVTTNIIVNKIDPDSALF